MTGNKPIFIYFVEPEEQRYKSAGDYYETSESYVFKITKQDNPDKNILILLHEIVEYFLCTKRDISEQSITDYDVEWNKRAEASNDWFADGIADEPGNQPGAPYFREHRFSENIERQVALEAGIDWFDYDRNLIV